LPVDIEQECEGMAARATDGAVRSCQHNYVTCCRCEFTGCKRCLLVC
jgi:hypothetical protein